tara:strand:- start:1231 stop:1734 length:504 start_codon:yes stop_codon:yes gene_type:complete
MLKIISFKIFFPLFFITFLSSCGNQKENFDIDISTIRIPKDNKVKISNKSDSDSLKVEDIKVENKLINYKKKSEVLRKVKLGKKDPFSKNNEFNKLNFGFKLKGLLKTKDNKYAVVTYLDKEGAITEESIGGVNTNLLPNGAKVINIDPINMKIIIKYESEDLIFEL